MYLTPDVVMGMMKFVLAASNGGGGIVFDYITPLAKQSLARRLRLKLLMRWLATVGEPWRSFFDAEVLTGELKALGFTHVEDLGPEDVNRRYFAGREDGFEVGGPVHLMYVRG